MKGLPELM